MEVDIFISLIGVSDFVVFKEMMENVNKFCKGCLLFMVDIVVFRDFDFVLNDFEGVFFYDIDDFEGIVEVNMKEWREIVEKVELLIEEIIVEFK